MVQRKLTMMPAVSGPLYYIEELPLVMDATYSSAYLYLSIPTLWYIVVFSQLSIPTALKLV